MKNFFLAAVVFLTACAVGEDDRPSAIVVDEARADIDITRLHSITFVAEQAYATEFGVRCRAPRRWPLDLTNIETGQPEYVGYEDWLDCAPVQYSANTLRTWCTMHVCSDFLCWEDTLDLWLAQNGFTQEWNGWLHWLVDGDAYFGCDTGFEITNAELEYVDVPSGS